MSLRTQILAGTATLIALGGATPAMAQSNDDVSVELLQLLVDEGVIPYDKAQALLDRAKKAAELRAQREAPRTAATIDVPYMPESVRNKIRDEVRTEVVETAKKEGWVSPNTLPDWVNRISISGDMRVRYEMQNFSEGNYPYFPDVGAINLAGGVTDAQGFPLLNSTIDRHRLNYRARLDIGADVSDAVKMGVRLSSGNERGAVSTNSIMGDFFQKDNIWIDRAYIAVTPVKQFTFTAGRIPNPFDTTDMVWDRDINPEGASARASVDLGEHAGVYATGAYFTMQERAIFPDTYMVGGQIGGHADLDNGIGIKAGVSYYDFVGLKSSKNAPDGSRLLDYTAPLFLDKGNSVFNVRTDGLTTLAGLASDFHLGIANLGVSYKSGALRFLLTGEAVKNFAANPEAIAGLRGEPGVKPGDIGWQVRLDAGYPEIRGFGQWNIAAAYKRIETDAVLDIFTDSDFGLGGTDVKGYLLEGNFGIYKNTSIGVNWFSTDAISRPPFSVDVLQLNLQTRF